jgi:hypothetical protein
MDFVCHTGSPKEKRNARQIQDHYERLDELDEHVRAGRKIPVLNEQNFRQALLAEYKALDSCNSILSDWTCSETATAFA